MSYPNVDKHIINYLHHFKRQQKIFDAHATKASSVILRKKFLDDQKRTNYQNEYDRIRGELSSTAVTNTHGTKAHLENRVRQLERLGASATQHMNGKKHTYDDLKREVTKQIILNQNIFYYFINYILFDNGYVCD